MRTVLFGFALVVSRYLPKGEIPADIENFMAALLTIGLILCVLQDAVEIIAKWRGRGK